MWKKFLISMFFILAAVVQEFASAFTRMNLILIGKAVTNHETEYVLMYFLNGVIAAISAMLESGHWYGIYSGIYILIVPLIALGLIKNKYYFLTIVLVLSVMMSTSLIVTGNRLNVLVGLSGLIALPVGVIFFSGIIASNLARDNKNNELEEIKKLLKEKH